MWLALPLLIVALAVAGLVTGRANATTTPIPLPTAPPGSTIVSSTVEPNGNRLTTFADTTPTPTTAPAAARTAARTATASATSGSGTCLEVTATSVYDAPVGRLWSFTSPAVFCYTRRYVTYLSWLTPSAHVTDNGTLAGWHYKGYDHWKKKINDHLRVGDSTGHFKQYYSAAGVTITIGSQDAVQHLAVTCGSCASPNWSWS